MRDQKQKIRDDWICYEIEAENQGSMTESVMELYTFEYFQISYKIGSAVISAITALMYILFKFNM